MWQADKHKINTENVTTNTKGEEDTSFIPIKFHEIRSYCPQTNSIYLVTIRIFI